MSSPESVHKPAALVAEDTNVPMEQFYEDEGGEEQYEAVESFTMLNVKKHYSNVKKSILFVSKAHNVAPSPFAGMNSIIYTSYQPRLG
jgi:hypothetical protein